MVQCSVVVLLVLGTGGGARGDARRVAPPRAVRGDESLASPRGCTTVAATHDRRKYQAVLALRTPRCAVQRRRRRAVPQPRRVRHWQRRGAGRPRVADAGAGARRLASPVPTPPAPALPSRQQGPASVSAVGAASAEPSAPPPSASAVGASSAGGPRGARRGATAAPRVGRVRAAAAGRAPPLRERDGCDAARDGRPAEDGLAQGGRRRGGELPLSVRADRFRRRRRRRRWRRWSRR